MSTKDAKKQALQELIKHMNKKRFKDKELPKAELKDAMSAVKPEEKEDKKADKGDEPKQKATPKDSGFDKYKKEFMAGGGRESSKASTLRVMAREGSSAPKAKAPATPRGFGSKKSG